MDDRNEKLFLLQIYHTKALLYKILHTYQQVCILTRNPLYSLVHLRKFFVLLAEMLLYMLITYLDMHLA
jgi:hypothetical protein